LSLLVLSISIACTTTFNRQDARLQRDLNALTSGQSQHFLLLGEIHDAKAQHQLRLRWLAQLASLAPGRPIALALEQLDADRQADVDLFIAALSISERHQDGTARRLAEAAGFNFSGWDWPLYEPVLQLALRSGWPVVAANLSSSRTMSIARGASEDLLQHIPFSRSVRDWSADDDARLATELQSGHCNALSAQRIPAMARAQRARDAQLAYSMSRALAKLSAASPSSARTASHGAGPLVILLAGNGHVRKDFGVPRYLAALHPQVASLSLGMLEEPAQGAGVFDDWVVTHAQARPDPCLAFKNR
jgi:uncharacterized iron-regulated protein